MEVSNGKLCTRSSGERTTLYNCRSKSGIRSCSSAYYSSAYYSSAYCSGAYCSSAYCSSAYCSSTTTGTARCRRQHWGGSCSYGWLFLVLSGCWFRMTLSAALRAAVIFCSSAVRGLLNQSLPE